MCLISYAVLWQKYASVMDKIKRATMNNANIRNGGSQKTQDLYRKAVSRYEEKFVGKTSKHGKLKSSKMSKDPLFEAAVDEIISENVQGILQKRCFLHQLYHSYQWFFSMLTFDRYR